MIQDLHGAAYHAQRTLCEAHGAEFRPLNPASMLGVSACALSGTLPLHGLRHPPTAGSSGWFIWSGDYSVRADFFSPVHAGHAIAASMPFVKFLGLAPGWRFLIGERGYVDVWFDPDLLDVREG